MSTLKLYIEAIHVFVDSISSPRLPNDGHSSTFALILEIR